MKVGDLVKFTKTGELVIITKIHNAFIEASLLTGSTIIAPLDYFIQLNTH